MDKQHIIDFEEFKTLSRPVSRHLDEMDVLPYIQEVEDQILIPAVGYDNYVNAILGGGSFDATFDATFVANILLNGGAYEWEDVHGRKTTRFCCGFKKAIAYLVYAKMLRADGTIITRAGAMAHNDQYASHIAQSGGHSAKTEQYNDVGKVADGYLNECLFYLNYHTKDNSVKPIKGRRTRIKAIGK